MSNAQILQRVTSDFLQRATSVTSNERILQATSNEGISTSNEQQVKSYARLHLYWTHFYNLVASFRRVQQQKFFVMLSGFWPLRGCGGGSLSEYIKICDENVAAAT